MKKLLSMVLAIVMCCSMLPTTLSTVKAAEYGLSNPRTKSFTTFSGEADMKTTWDCVYFGNYPQSDSSGATVEPIKWRVLSVDGDDAFLLADQNLDCQMYNTENTTVTWETCSLRTWLNEDFFDKAFSSSEQSAILPTTVVNEDNPEYGTDGGNNTTDRVYLLSISEVLNEDYGFPSNVNIYSNTRKGKNTAYAIAQGADTSTVDEYAGLGYWWLRSPGERTSYATRVTVNAFIYMHGDNVSYNRFAVRPALHLDLSSSDLWSYAGTVCSDESSGEEENEETPTVVAKDQKITVSKNSYSFTFNSAKAQDQSVSVSGAKGKLSYTSSNSKYVSVKDGKITVAKGTPAGTYTIKVSAVATADGEYKASNTVTITVIVGKAANTVKVTPSKKNYKVAKVKKKAQSFKIKVTKAQGKVTYKSMSKKVKVTAKGKVTVKKGTKKGKYKITITAAGNKNYEKASKTVTVIVK